MSNIKIYYNSSCPVCKAGVENQQCRMGAQDISNVTWLDVHMNPELVKEIGADLESVRERLHVMNADGSVHIGVDAFALLFKKTRGQKWLGIILSLPVIRQLGQFTYKILARALYKWNRLSNRW